MNGKKCKVRDGLKVNYFGLYLKKACVFPENYEKINLDGKYFEVAKNLMEGFFGESAG